MLWDQRSHLQEVLVGQHHLEPHFSLEDPKNNRKNCQGAQIVFKDLSTDSDSRLSI